MADMDNTMDLDVHVHSPRKAIKLNHSLTILNSSLTDQQASWTDHTRFFFFFAMVRIQCLELVIISCDHFYTMMIVCTVFTELIGYVGPRTFPMAWPKCLPRDFTNLNRIDMYNAHRTNVWWAMEVFQLHCMCCSSGKGVCIEYAAARILSATNDCRPIRRTCNHHMQNKHSQSVCST